MLCPCALSTLTDERVHTLGNTHVCTHIHTPYPSTPVWKHTWYQQRCLISSAFPSGHRPDPELGNFRFQDGVPFEVMNSHSEM